MSRKTFDTGDTIELTGEFYHPDTAAPLDPTAVTITVEKPNDLGTITPSVTRLSVGRYQTTVLPDTGEHGRWWYRIAGTGAVESAQERYFVVRRSQVS